MDIRLLENIKEKFKISQFRGDQQKIIESAYQGQPTLVLMPTGMGKSLCYQSIASLKKGLVVVVSPLIALMKDQKTKAASYGIRVEDIHSQQSKEKRKSSYVKLKNKELDLIFVSPERFKKKDFLEALNCNEISLFALDEAHCISQWGHDFRPEYSRMGEVWKSLGKPTLMLLTATATTEVVNDFYKQFGNIKKFSSGFLRKNIQIQIEDLYSFESKIDYLNNLQFETPAIIYFSLISTLQKVSQNIKTSHVVYHGQLPKGLREQSQKKFLLSEENLILATPAFGLGIDKKDIRTIIHFEVPNSIESFYQEIGRAGRDGKPSKSILLYDQEDIEIQMEFIKWTHPDPDFILSSYNLLKQNVDKLNAVGIDWFKEKLSFKNKKDFRFETVLNIFERFNITEGSFENKNLSLTEADIPEELLDKKLYEQRLKNSQLKLLKVIQFVNSKECRIKEIMNYFEQEYDENCKLCDNCKVI